MKRWSLFWALLVVAGMACSALPGLGDDGESQEAEVSTGGAVLFQDEFEDPNSGWEVGNYETGEVGYREGQYFVLSRGGGNTMWGVAGRNFDDVIIEVQATQVQAPPNDNNDYGVVCREQGDGSGYYLLISGDGLYSIQLASQGSFEQLVEWAESDVIRQGNATNDIMAVCDGDTLSLYVNGELLASVSDSTFRSGDIALTATSYEAGPTVIHFDHLVVREP